MALTIATPDKQSPDVFGRHRAVVVEVTFDASYETGGESLTPANVGLAEIFYVDASVDAASAPGHVVQYNYTTKKLQVYVEEAVAAGGPLLEAANLSNLSTLKARVLVLGI